MGIGTRLGGSLAVRLLTIAIVPLLALGLTASDRIDRERNTAAASAILTTDIALQRDVASMIGPANLERIALLGLAKIDDLGVDRAIVAQFTGLDFGAIYADNNIALDKAFATFADTAMSVTSADGARLNEDVTRLIGEIAEHRRLSDAREADAAAIVATFEELDLVLSDAVDLIDPSYVEASGAATDVARLDELANVLSSAGELTQAVIGGLDDLSVDNSTLLIRSSAVHETHVNEFKKLLDDEQLQHFLASTTPMLVVDDDPMGVQGGDATDLAGDPAVVAGVAAVFLDQVDYLEHLEAYSSEFHQQLLNNANDRADAAASAARRGVFLTMGIAAIAVLSTLFVLLTIAPPLVRLSQRARAVSRGELSSDPLPLQGPQVVRQLTTSVNDMLVTLHGVDSQIEKMSVGDLDAAVEIELPGAIGVSMRQSVARLSNMTEELAFQARHDLLTGLPNRYATMEHLDGLLERDQDFALLFVDVDGFKGVNDTQGHEAGDAVLREIGSRLASTVRPSEFVARLGGDEFIIVVTDFAHMDETIALGHRLIQEVELPYGEGRGENIFSLSASIGVVASEPTMSSLDALRQADTALYLAKHRGRGRVERYDALLQAQIQHEADLSMALRQAVRNGELELHYQPILTVATGEMDSAEALVRWNRPGIGLVSPAEFIPIAERSSLIFDIERWVLTEACRTIVGWRDRDSTCTSRLAVNISGRHLIEGDLIEDLDAALDTTGADPSMLEFELTETHLLEDLDLAITVLNTLRSRGISIAVDDFGTGYSSMNYLRDLPIDVIKIDRTFIARSTEKGYDSTVIEAVLTIARSLNLTVVAEGIETDAQLEYIRSVGCHRAQGFLLARPTPLDAANAVMFATAHV